MATFTYKCPNCNGGLLFNPNAQDFECEYCASRFTEEQIKGMDQMAGADAGKAEGTAEEAKPEVSSGGNGEQLDGTALYICPSCGAEVVTDETTAATFCFYCHNPIVLSQRLSGQYTPDSVIPFTVTKEQAIEKFFEWVGSRKYVPDEFVSAKQLETITGIYFPHWVAGYKIRAVFKGKAKKVRRWTEKDRDYVETKHFEVVREGEASYDNMVRNALNTEHAKLLESVQPFDMNMRKNFVSAYLSGFQAEKRNIEAKVYKKEIEDRGKAEAAKKTKSQVSGYALGSVSGNMTKKVAKADWKYTLLPVWILAYKDAQGRLYHFAMNGQTGKLQGVVPLDEQKVADKARKISTFIFGIGAAIVALGVLGGIFA